MTAPRPRWLGATVPAKRDIAPRWMSILGAVAFAIIALTWLSIKGVLG